MSLNEFLVVGGIVAFLAVLNHIKGLSTKNQELSEQVEAQNSKQKLESQDESYQKAKQEADSAVANYEQLKSEGPGANSEPVSGQSSPRDSKPNS